MIRPLRAIRGEPSAIHRLPALAAMAATVRARWTARRARYLLDTVPEATLRDIGINRVAVLAGIAPTPDAAR